MANNTIQIKRNALGATPTALSHGELAWSDNAGGAGYLYIGDATAGTPAVVKIGGEQWGLDLLEDSALTGDTTFEGGATGVAGSGTARYLVDPAWSPGTGSTGTATQKLELATLAYVDAQVVAGGTIGALGDTAIGGTLNGPVGAAQVLIYGDDPDQTGTNRWINKSISGDVGIQADGTTAVTSVTGEAIELNTNTSGTYVSSVTQAADGNIVVLPNVTGDADAVTIGLANSVTIAGDLTVNGTTTTVATDVVTLKDPVFQIGEQSVDTADRGIKIDWNDGSNVKSGFFGMDKTDNKFRFWADCTVSATNEVTAGTVGDVEFSDITGTTINGTTITGSVELTAPSVVGTTVTGTLQTALQPNVTGLGTISSGTWGPNATTIAVESGGTGRITNTTQAILLGNGTGAMTELSFVVADAGKMLMINDAGTALEYSTINGGTF